MQKESLTISHTGRTLHGTLYLPKAEHAPLVVFCHGFNGYETDFAPAAELLADNGVAAFCLTFCGASLRDKSGFPKSEMTLLTQKEDLLAAYAALRARREIDEQRIFFFGGSQGGLVSALAAEEKRGELCGLILLYPALCIADDWNRRFPAESDIPETVTLWDFPIGRKYFLALRDLDVRAQLGGFSGPVLILHGAKDAIVPLSYAEWAAKRYPRAELRVFAEEGHGFTEAGNRAVAEATLAFVRAREGG